MLCSRTGRYGQAIGSSVADASTLQLISTGYLKDNPEKQDLTYAHLKRIIGKGSLFRYKNHDDFA